MADTRRHWLRINGTTNHSGHGVTGAVAISKVDTLANVSNECEMEPIVGRSRLPVIMRFYKEGTYRDAMTRVAMAREKVDLESGRVASAPLAKPWLDWLVGIMVILLLIGIVRYAPHEQPHGKEPCLSLYAYRCYGSRHTQTCRPAETRDGLMWSLPEAFYGNYTCQNVEGENGVDYVMWTPTI